MRLLKTFFRTAVLSSISPIYYNDILKTKMWFSVKYFAMLQFVLSLIASIAILTTLAQLDVFRIISTVVSLFPSDLVITAQNGKVMINQPLPYEIPFPGYTNAENTLQAKNIVVFEKEGLINNISDMRDRSALIVITESSFYALRKSNEMSVGEIPSYGERIELTQQTFRDFGQKIMTHKFMTYKLYVPLAAVIVVPSLFMFTLLIQVIALFFFSIISWIITKFFLKNNLGFGSIYRLSLHSITPILLVSTALEYAHKPVMQGFFYFIPYLVWTIVCLRAIEVHIPSATHKKKS